MRQSRQDDAVEKLPMLDRGCRYPHRRRRRLTVGVLVAGETLPIHLLAVSGIALPVIARGVGANASRHPTHTLPALQSHFFFNAFGRFRGPSSQSSLAQPCLLPEAASVVRAI